MSANPALSLECCVTAELASLFRSSACSLFKVFKRRVGETEDLKCHAKGLGRGRCPLPTPILLNLLPGLSATGPPTNLPCSRCQQSEQVRGRQTDLGTTTQWAKNHLQSRPSEERMPTSGGTWRSRGSFPPLSVSQRIAHCQA